MYGGRGSTSSWWALVKFGTLLFLNYNISLIWLYSYGWFLTHLFIGSSLVNTESNMSYE